VPISIFGVAECDLAASGALKPATLVAAKRPTVPPHRMTLE